MANQQMTLAEFLGQLDKGSSDLLRGKEEKEKAAYQKQLEDEAFSTRLKALEDLRQKHPGKTVQVGKEGASIHENPALATIDLRKEKMLQDKSKAYSQSLEKMSDFISSINDIEDLTNRGGKGGVVTNPQSKLVSTGKMASAVPTAAMGVGELLGLAPKGSADERKALERLNINYSKAMQGSRPTEGMVKLEKQAIGWIASGDPDLVSKGVRALARNVKNHVDIIQSGYAPEVKEAVHGSLGYDPKERLSRTYDDYSQDHMASTQAAQGSRAVASPQAPVVSPQAAPASVQAPAGPLKVRHKASGQTGVLTNPSELTDEYEVLK